MRRGIGIILICAILFGTLFVALAAARDIDPTPAPGATVEEVLPIDPSILTPWSAVRCLTCTDLINANQSNLLLMLNEQDRVLTIYAYYEANEGTPPEAIRKPINNSMILVEVTNSSGLRQLFKVFTNSDGRASFSFSEFRACSDFRIMYCPYCLPGSRTCAFNMCAEFLRVNTTGGYYSNIAREITNAGAIPTRGITPAPLNAIKYLPSMTTRSYCAPQPVASGTPAMCLPLIIIFTLLGGALYASGRNPFASFNIGSAHVGKHIRYQARGRGFQMNVQSLVGAAQQVKGIAKGFSDAKAEGKSTLSALHAAGTQSIRILGVTGMRQVAQNIGVASQSLRVVSDVSKSKNMTAAQKATLFTQQMDARLGGASTVGGTRQVVSGGQTMTVATGAGQAQRGMDLMGVASGSSQAVRAITAIGSFIGRFIINIIGSTTVVSLFNFSNTSLFNAIFSSHGRNMINDLAAAQAADAARNLVGVRFFGDLNILNSRRNADGTYSLVVETPRGTEPGQTRDGRMTVILDRDGNVVSQSYSVSLPPAQLARFGLTTEATPGAANVDVQVVLTRNPQGQTVASIYAINPQTGQPITVDRNGQSMPPLGTMVNPYAPNSHASRADLNAWTALMNAMSGGIPRQFAFGTQAGEVVAAHQAQIEHSNQVFSTFETSRNATRLEAAEVAGRDHHGDEVAARVAVSEARSGLQFTTAVVNGRAVSLLEAGGSDANNNPTGTLTAIEAAHRTHLGSSFTASLSDAITPSVPWLRSDATLSAAGTAGSIISGRMQSMSIAEMSAPGTGLTNPEQLRGAVVVDLARQLQQANPSLTSDAAKQQAVETLNRLPESCWNAAAAQIQTACNGFTTAMNTSPGGSTLSNALANVDLSRITALAGTGSLLRLDVSRSELAQNQGNLLARASPADLATLSPEARAAVVQMQVLDAMANLTNAAHSAAERGDSVASTRLYGGTDQVLRDFALAAASTHLENQTPAQRSLTQDGLANLSQSYQIMGTTPVPYVTASTEDENRVRSREERHRNDIEAGCNSPTSSQQDRANARNMASERLEYYQSIGDTPNAAIYQSVIDRIDQYTNTHPGLIPPGAIPPQQPASGITPVELGASAPTRTGPTLGGPRLNPEGVAEANPHLVSPPSTLTAPEMNVVAASEGVIRFPPMTQFNASEVANRENFTQAHRQQQSELANDVSRAAASGDYTSAYAAAGAWHDTERTRLQAMGLDTRAADQAYQATVNQIDTSRTDATRRQVETGIPSASATNLTQPELTLRSGTTSITGTTPTTSTPPTTSTTPFQLSEPSMTRPGRTSGIADDLAARPIEPSLTPSSSESATPSREEQEAVARKQEQGLGQEASFQMQFAAMRGEPIDQETAISRSLGNRFQAVMNYTGQPSATRAYEDMMTTRAHSYDDFIRSIPEESRPQGENESGLPTHASQVTTTNTPPPPPRTQAESGQLAREHPPTAPWSPATRSSVSSEAPSSTSSETPPSPAPIETPSPQTSRPPTPSPPEEPPSGSPPSPPPEEPPPRSRTTRRTEPTGAEEHPTTTRRRGRPRT